MKRLILSISSLLALCSLTAQTTREETLSDLGRTGGVYYAYPDEVPALTPAPKGYKPVYVSHYGRHGSRYLISDNDYNSVRRLLADARDKNALTPLGLDACPHRLSYA